ncbi:FdhF/YdeP family oxidoreductase [Aeromicrobium wangtongii]|uniref:FdhF/YdeP family oxidoreductase n=1 Tax=Aeromicrobium wangtongii TaxID=2969247 RepID=A0ABY5M567_9ACTN|nr:FdhF/YdeP family oxidoreductase [Aeromicrobium wangtongii]MCD9199015.1 FdhF/YdeP family oxidoreductase [Aeromicrobium wangtongii]UUP12952.1 FdhF/YdeP family oxidoreductase [Aeromicrobium wangtongii]
MSKSHHIDESELEVHYPKNAAAGITGVRVALTRSLANMGVTRSARTLLKLNQTDGFDCMSCAWPDPDPENRHTAEFCENGAKAVADEGTRSRATPEFFARHSVRELEAQDDYWLNEQGRITHPMVKRPGATHYQAIPWDEAFGLIAGHLKSIDPDEAVFYTSGRASNEAAFLYQLFIRAYGTNNMPDCSNMCHESSGTALTESIGIGKGSVSLRDIYDAELIVIAGQNPGTNHPRMLSALEIAKRRGAKIVSVNPLREAGLVNFRNPQVPRGVVGRGTDIADVHLPIRLNGDLALFQGIGSLLVEWDALDHDFVAEHTDGFEEWAEHVRAVDWPVIESTTGLTRQQITEVAEMIRDSNATIYCWAMGLTQHRNSVATIKEIVNVALARGDIGKRGAGLCPVRGHSNVQGDRTMGIWERAPEHFLDSLQAEFGFDPPREHGLDTVDAIRAFRDDKASFFMGLGGNFVAAAPDTEVTAKALKKAAMTVQVATKINRSMLECGETALILPTMGRTEKNMSGSGEQFITVEDSMSAVHASRGVLEPASPYLRSEVAIIAGIAEATIGKRHGIDWAAMAEDYDIIRDHISRVVAGCEDYSRKADRPGGFVLPHPPRDSRTFETKTGKAHFVASPLEVLQVPDGHLVLQTLRSHDQFNTVIYGLSDRYRGIEDGRRVVFVHPDDIVTQGFHDGDLVDIVAHWEDDDVKRVAEGFRIVAYDTPRGSSAAYYPETNPLVPLDSTATGSNQPSSKSVIVRLVPAGTGQEAGAEQGASQDSVGSDEGHKSDRQPRHLS